MAARNALWSIAFALALNGCDQARADLREWRASDHDHTSNPNADQVEVSQDAGSPGGMHGIDEVIIVAWRQNCVNCHGMIGRGDGPQGPMVRATDLTNPAWQRGVTDEGIARTIRSGKGTMPAFNLPDPTISGLVRLIRILNVERIAQLAASAGLPAPSVPAAPANSAPAHRSNRPAATPTAARQEPVLPPVPPAGGR